MVDVKVTTRAKKERVEEVADGRLRVWVRAVPEKGKANEAVADALSRHFGVRKSAVSLVRGATSAQKVFNIGE